MKRTTLMLTALALAACDDAGGGGGAADAAVSAGTLKAGSVQTLPFATDDGSEVIKMLPSGDRAVLIASRTGRMTLLAVEEDKLQELKTIELYRDGEVGELTHIAISDDGAFAAITRAIPVEQDGELVGCEGELLLVNVAQNFGQVSKRLAVGPMPDGVDITSDGRWIVTADEADHFRRCPLPDVHGSVTLIELPGGIPSQAVVRARITMDRVGEAHREPETIAFAPDDDRVAVTLQDTHELLFFRRTALLAAGDDPREITVRPVTDFTLTRYPDRADGKPPWPDGLAGFTDDAGAAWFVATGEFNDTFAIFDADGGFLSQTAIDAAALPADLPRDPEDTLGGVIRPDSVATLRYAGHRIFALSLKHAGAVGLWIADDLMAPTFLDLVRVGQSETGSPTTASSVSPEGIAAADRGLVVTANEGESSASLLRLVLEPLTAPMDQLDLFGALPAPPPAPVAAPAHPPALAALGAKLPPQVHLGCSSWTFPGWAGHVYAGRPAERALIDGGLAAYHQHPLLRGVSVDRGLYGPLAAATYAGMAAQVGAGFRFWTKIHQDVTLARFPDLAAFGAQRGALNPRWLDPAYTAEAVVGPILAGLGDRAGPILFQFTPGHASEVPAEAFAERLHGVLQALPRGPLYAVELRDSSLMTKDYADALADVGAAHCYSSHPRTLDLDFQRLRLPPVLAPALVLRWNLGGGLSRPDAIRRFAPYDRLQHPQLGTRALIARLCRQAAQRGQPVHLVVGNHAEGCAPLTLQAIAEGIVAG